jgi:hypothetical protein
MSDELNETFLDYMSYLVFMAAQLPWGYGSFALVKGLGKVLELKALSGELRHDDLCARLKAELDAVEGTPSSETETWNRLLDRLISILTEEMKRE